MAMHTDGSLFQRHTQIHGNDMSIVSNDMSIVSNDMSIVSNDKIIAITGHKTQQRINVAVATQKYADTIHIVIK